MKRSVTAILLAGLFSVSCTSLRGPREAKDLDEVMTALRQAQSLHLRDVGRNESGLNIIEYPYAVEGREAVQKFLALIEKARFQFDEEETEFFRSGGVVDANVFLEVAIDEKVSFMVFTANMIKTDNFRMYVAKKYDPLEESMQFTRDLNSLLKKIGRKVPNKFQEDTVANAPDPQK